MFFGGGGRGGDWVRWVVKKKKVGMGMEGEGEMGWEGVVGKEREREEGV